MDINEEEKYEGILKDLMKQKEDPDKKERSLQTTIVSSSSFSQTTKLEIFNSFILYGMKS